MHLLEKSSREISVQKVSRRQNVDYTDKEVATKRWYFHNINHKSLGQENNKEPLQILIIMVNYISDPVQGPSSISFCVWIQIGHRSFFHFITIIYFQFISLKASWINEITVCFISCDLRSPLVFLLMQFLSSSCLPSVPSLNWTKLKHVKSIHCLSQCKILNYTGNREQNSGKFTEFTPKHIRVGWQIFPRGRKGKQHFPFPGILSSVYVCVWSSPATEVNLDFFYTLLDLLAILTTH